MTAVGERIVVFQRADARWDWHLVGANNELMCGTVQGYETEAGARDGFARVVRALRDRNILVIVVPLTEPVA